MRYETGHRLKASIVAFMILGVVPTLAQSGAKEGEKPVAVITRSWGPPIEVYRADVEKDLDAIGSRVEHLVVQAEKVKIPEGKDAVETMIPGAISLARHEQDIAETRDHFTKCVAIMMNQMEEKESSGTATKEDKAQFEKCKKHCDQVLAKLNSMHLNAARLSTATRRQYILDGWDKHRKELAELQKMTDECVGMMKHTLECCQMPAGAAKK